MGIEPTAPLGIRKAIQPNELPMSSTNNHNKCKKRVKCWIYIGPFSCGYAQRSFTMIGLSPADRKHIYIQSGQCKLVLILPTPEAWKSQCTIAGNKVTQIFNLRPGRRSNWGPQDWEAEIFTTAPTPPLLG